MLNTMGPSGSILLILCIINLTVFIKGEKIGSNTEIKFDGNAGSSAFYGGHFYPYYNICDQNETRGFYIPTIMPATYITSHCCKRKVLEPPSIITKYPSPLRYDRVASPFEILTECRQNVTRDNVDDDLPTLMAKSEACMENLSINKPESEINFNSYVEFRMQNYTNDTDVQKAILDSNNNHGCPEGAKETVLFKKLAAFYWCFHRNEEKACDEPTKEAIEARKRIVERVLKYNISMPKEPKEICPELPSSLSQATFCCRGKPTPTPWINAVRGPRRIKYSYWRYRSRNATSDSDDLEILKMKLKNCSESTFGVLHKRFRNSVYPYPPYPSVTEGKSIENASTTIVNPTNSSEFNPSNMPLFSPNCFDACKFNPVIFENNTSGPEIQWDFDKLMENYLNQILVFNSTKVISELKEIVIKEKTSYKIAITNDDLKERTGRTFQEIEKAYEESSDADTRVQLYCSYYDAFHKIAKKSLAHYCGTEVSANFGYGMY